MALAYYFVFEESPVTPEQMTQDSVVTLLRRSLLRRGGTARPASGHTTTPERGLASAVHVEVDQHEAAHNPTESLQRLCG
jgi:hypothetical protein